jgi:FtsZ-binding cell division protein ZapB
VTEKLDLLEARVRTAVDTIKGLRRENEKLKGELATLKSQMDIVNSESRKVQRILAEYDQMKRNHDQAVGRVERALTKLNAMRLH